MGILKSEYDRGREDGRAEAERREKEGTTVLDIILDIGGVADIVNPEYGNGYQDGFNKK